MNNKLRLALLLCFFWFEGVPSLEGKVASRDTSKKESVALAKRLDAIDAQQKNAIAELKKGLDESKAELGYLRKELEAVKDQTSAVTTKLIEEFQGHQRELASSKELERVLVKYGNNPDGMSTLHYAVKVGDLNAVQLLIANGADVSSKDGDFTALTRAAAFNQFEISKFLLGLGVDVNLVAHEKEYQYSTNYALDYAAESGSAELVSLLIEYGAILDRTRPNDDSGYPKGPLHTAAKAGNYEAVVALVQAGAKIDGIAPQKTSHAGDNNNMTPLGVAAIQLKYTDNPQYLDLVKFLVENGATRRLISFIKATLVAAA